MGCLSLHTEHKPCELVSRNPLPLPQDLQVICADTKKQKYFLVKETNFLNEKYMISLPIQLLARRTRTKQMGLEVSSSS